MKNFNMQNHAKIVNSFGYIQDAVDHLTRHWVDILSITIRQSKPVIRIMYSPYCDELLKKGSASYRYHGKSRQGVFELCNCVVVWSDSLSGV